jgi:electron transfer flavoprotein alpha subunit
MLQGSPEEIVDKLIEVLKSQRRVEIMARIFAYIVHKGGVADDSAAELAAAAKKIDPRQSPAPVVTGWGADLDAVCEACAVPTARSGKSGTKRWFIPTPNWSAGPGEGPAAGSIVLVPHSHFGIDLSPGLSIKMNAAYVPDVLDIDGSCGRDRAESSSARNSADR